jgi:hypothetical protein
MIKGYFKRPKIHINKGLYLGLTAPFPFSDKKPKKVQEN